MIKPTEDLNELSKKVRQLADEIAAMKARFVTLESGPERRRLKREIKDKQYQALFYIEKIENLGREKRGKNTPL